MELEVRILGPLEVAANGEPARLGGRKQRSLIALLALEPGEVVSADRLIEELWPDYDPRARARLQVYVSQLRKALGPGGQAVEWRSEGYVLGIAPDAVDASRFERLAGAGASELRAGDLGAAARTLREALDLWRGPALEGCTYGALTQPIVSRLDELRLSALEDRIEADLALGRAQELVAELEGLAAEHPLRERLRGQQMLALYRAGRQTDALEVYAAARRELLEQLGLEPGADLRRLQEAILRQDPALDVEPEELRARRHLPAPGTALVGRRAALDDLVRMLGASGVRLVTLTGVGGAGKTRLAIQAGSELAERFDGGVYFVELAPVEDPALVPQAVAHALGLEERTDEPLPVTLANHLRHRRLLLVLDNLEHAAEAAPLAGELLEQAPGLKVLATSRAPLRLYGEHEYLVPPLGLPDAALPPDPETAIAAEAVALFAARAEAARQGFRLTQANAGAVVELCRALDGLPLAIELAAARSKTLTPQEMLAALPGRLELAAEGPRDVPARHRTLRATIDWSYGLLTPAARQLFAHLAVFVGGFSAEAADEVCGSERPALAELVEQSLLVPRVGGHGGSRLEMLETVREYAHERLGESEDAAVVRAKHAEHFAALAEAAEPVLGGREGDDRLAALEDDHANLRAALAWAQQSDSIEAELRLAGSLARFWELAGYLREGSAQVEAALSERVDAPPELRAKVLIGATRLALRRGDYARMRSGATESLELCTELGDRRGVARSLNLLATAASNEGDHERGTTLYEQSAVIYRELEDELGLASTTSDLGCLALMEGDPVRAAALSEEALAHYSKTDQRYGMLAPLFNLGLASLRQGDHQDALERFLDGLELGRDLGYREQVFYSLEGLAATRSALGDHQGAAKLLGAAQTVAVETGSTLEPLEREMHDRAVEVSTAALGAADFAAAEAEGRSLGPAEAVALGLEAHEART